MKVSKRQKEISSKVDTSKEYSLEEAIKVIKENSTVKFNESLDCAMKLGVDPRHADQMIRGTVSLPHGTGKEVKVMVLSKSANPEAAIGFGADYAGFDDYIEKIKGGWTEFDVLIATPDSMADVGKLGRTLGPRGLMPNPKSGTVTNDIEKAIKEVKAGKIEFRNDKTGIVHTSLGKLDFSEEQLLDNTKAFIKTIVKMRPSSAKGQYLKSLYLSSTMGPGLQISREEALTIDK